jgi:hypothetical protein
MAFIIWAQNMGPTIFLTLYETIFTNSIGPDLARNAPGADAAAIINAGATGFRSVTSSGDLPGVLQAYSASLGKIYYLVASAACVSFLTAFAMGWNDTRPKEGENAAQPAMMG